jgi:hypothetical protein
MSHFTGVCLHDFSSLTPSCRFSMVQQTLPTREESSKSIS